MVAPTRAPAIAAEYEAVMALQDWTNERPGDVLDNLKKDGDYYALKKDSVISIAGYMDRNAIGTWFSNRWRRMGGMDVSDVAYDAFLINGLREQHLFPDALPGDRIQLRFINAGASTYFLLHSDELEFVVIAADDLDVTPVLVDEVLHAVAEAYDIIVTVPRTGKVELRASAQDGSGFASLFIGRGEIRPAEAMPRPDLYASHTDHNGSGSMDMHAHHGMHSGPKRLTYADLQTLNDEPYTSSGELREVALHLTGNMETYNWTFNNTPLSRADRILIKRGETVRFIFVNETMMHHPLHLHGHFFRMLDQAGNGPFKHTVNVAPMQTVTIEFLANKEKDWFFHCHNLYHAKTGMARVARYDDYSGNADFNAGKRASRDIKDPDFYYAGELKLMNDFARIGTTLSNNQHRFEVQIESRDYEDHFGEAAYLYRLNRWAQPLLGIEKDRGEDAELKLGLRYVLPMLIDMDVFITSEGAIEAEFETELQLSTRLQMHLEYETTNRYHYGLEYRLNEALSLETSYTSDVEFSAGIKLRF